MKNIRKYLMLLGLTALAVSCDTSDPGGDVTLPSSFEIDESTPLGQRTREMYNDYGVLFRAHFDDADYKFNWTSIMGESALRIERVTDDACAIKMIEFIKDEVFPLLPRSVILDYMPGNILLMSKVATSTTVYNADHNELAPEWQSITGCCLSTCVLVGNVNAQYDLDDPATRKEAKENLIALFVEKLLSNALLPENPIDEFRQMARDYTKTRLRAAYEKRNADWNSTTADFSDPLNVIPRQGQAYTNIDTYLTDTQLNSYMPYPELTTSPSLYSSMQETGDSPADSTEYWGMAMIKPGRGLYAIYAEGTVFGVRYPYSIGYKKCTAPEDFGNYVSFIISRTAAQKQAFYNEVEAKPHTYRMVLKTPASDPLVQGSWQPDNRDTKIFGGPVAVAEMRRKVDFVKAWFRNSLHAELVEPQ